MPPTHRRPLSRFQSLRWRLPMLSVALVGAALVVFLWAAYGLMERALIETGRTRAQGAADQLVGLMAAPAQQRALDMRRVAADVTVRQFLASPDDGTRTRAEERVRTLVTSGRQVIEVWSRSGVRLLVISQPATAEAEFPRPAPPTSDALRLAQNASGAIISDIVEEIPSSPGNTVGVLGYLVMRRPVATSPPDALNKLMGGGAQIRLGAFGGPWTDLVSVVEPSAAERSGAGVLEFQSKTGEQRIAAVAPIQGTAWVVSVEFPRAIFLAPAHTFLLRSTVVALVLVGIAGLICRLLAARITRPLAALTDASEAVAAGDYSPRVTSRREDELGRLSAAFNSMVAQIRDAHEHLTLAVQGSKVGIWEWSSESEQVFLSPQWKEMLGYADSDLHPNQSLMRDLVHPEDWDSVSAGIRACMTGAANDWDSEHRLRRKDGSYIWVLARGVVNRTAGQPVRFAGTSIDITALKSARDEAALQGRQAAFVADVAVALTEGGELGDMLTRCARAIVEHLDADIARVWIASTTDDVLKLAAFAGEESETHSVPTEVPIGAFALGRVAVDRQPIIDNAVDPAQYATEEIVRGADLKSYAAFPLILGDRLVGVLSMFGRKALTESTLVSLGSVSRTVALGIERKQLEETRSRFEDLLESATDFVTIGRLTGPPVYINRAARQALGIEPGEQIPSLLAFRPTEFQERFETTVLPAALCDGTWKGRSEYVSRSGRTIPVSQVSIAHKDSGGRVEYLSTISRDISDELRTAQERELLEDQLRRAQRLEAIGQLAGGLAHDFNNLLTIILGYTNVLDDQFDKTDPRRDDIEQIRRAGDRASQLTRQLLAFSRKQILNPIVLNPNDLIEEVTPMLRRLMGETIQVAVRCSSEVSAIKFDPAQMELILVNLAVNARDAMPNGGTLTVETQDVDLDQDFCRTHLSVEPGHYVRLSVTDTGVGIDDETKKRVFEPFFTTKGRDKGTGLGLATVFGIVKQSGGSVWVYSEPGLGASFKIFLPAVQQVHGAAGTRVARPVPVGTETILVVEDEGGVRGLVQTVLKRGGYTVLTASRPDEAIKIAGNPNERIDLLLTDVVMPDMNGAALARELAKARPELRVLFMSGFADDIIEHHGVLATGTAFLQKPFTTADLARKVRQVLDHVASPQVASQE